MFADVNWPFFQGIQTYFCQWGIAQAQFKSHLYVNTNKVNWNTENLTFKEKIPISCGF